MYKMKEVCKMTGLTEKAIRIYMEQKLVEPKVEEGVHRKAYFFREGDIERLKDISALRSAGFSIAEIKQMLENPANISVLVEEKETMLAAEIQQKLAVQEALRHLTIQEHSDLTKLADAIEPRSTYAKETPRKRISRKKKWLILGMIMGIVLYLSYKTAGRAGVWIPLSGVGLVFGITAVVFSIRYFICSRRDRKKECCGVGIVTAVVENEKVEEYIGKRERSMFQEVMAYLTFGMFGEGIWDLLRPDCWYPVISYQTKDGQSQIVTVRYGGFKQNWSIGEEIEIAWEEGQERLVYACDGQIVRKKAFFYLIVGMLLLGMFGIGTMQLFAKKENNQQISNDAVIQRLEYPKQAENVIIEQGNVRYELNEIEKEVLKTLFEEAEIKSAEYYYSVNYGGTSILHFYQGEEEIQTFRANQFSYILTSDYMLYQVLPIQITLYGTQLGDSNYITGFLSKFGGKVGQRYVTEQILTDISNVEHLKALKQLLEQMENFDGAYAITDGYEFFLSKAAYENYFGEPMGELERGKLEVVLQDGTFISASLLKCCYNEIGEVEILEKKEWK